MLTEKEFKRAYFGDAELDATAYVAELQERVARLRKRLREVPVRDGALRWVLEKDLAALRRMVIDARVEALTKSDCHCDKEIENERSNRGNQARNGSRNQRKAN